MRWRCHACGSGTRYLEWEGDGQCPRCGRGYVPGAGQVAPLTDVHLVVMAEDGPIWGGEGRQRVACQPRRDYLATTVDDFFAASDDPRAVTCPACRATREYQGMAALFPEIAIEEGVRRSIGLTVTRRK